MGEPARRRMRPSHIHATVGLILTLLIAFSMMRFCHWSWTLWHLVAAWLIGVNVTTFGYYLFDKLRAKEAGRRVPEIVLHGLALAGGSAGAFAGMKLFRHKTVKARFRLVFLIIVLLQVLVMVWIAYTLWRGRE